MGQCTARNCAGGGLVVEVYLSFEHFLLFSSALWIIKIQAHSNSIPDSDPQYPLQLSEAIFDAVKMWDVRYCIDTQSPRPSVIISFRTVVPPDVMKDPLSSSGIKVS